MLLGFPSPMKLWPLLSIFLLASPPALLGQDVVRLVEKGEDALANGLWEVAELRFRECLSTPSLSPEKKAEVALHLAESLIRAGKSTEALECLSQSYLAKHPEQPFWKAQATAGTGRFAEAVEIFSQLLANPEAPYRTEAGFSKASLQLSLAQPESALETLRTLAGDGDLETSTKAKLLEVEILLDLSQPAEARKLMPSGDQLAVRNRPLAAFLEANLLFKEGHFPEATAAFQAIVLQPQGGQSLTHFHSAAIGLADALQADGKQEDGAKALLAFIQEYPDSPMLDAMFKRLQQWMPEVPALTDPILEQLGGWIRKAEQPMFGLIANPPDVDSAAAAAWPTVTKTDDLLAFSLFTRAIGLHRRNTPLSRAEARLLMTRLRLENADHLLATRALYQMAGWLLEEGSADHAIAVLDTLRDTTKSPILRGEAAFLEARNAYQNGDMKQAIRLFDVAGLALTDGPAKSARLNAGIARLRGGELKGVTLIQQTGGRDDKELETDLELERALATTAPAEQRKSIETFLTSHPDHPRASEARLIAAESALTNQPPDIGYATAQLDSLAHMPEGQTSVPPVRIDLARLRIADLSGDSAATITLARSILETHPDSKDAALILGRNLLETKDYNPARLILEELAYNDTDPGRAQAAWFLAARSAALVGTLSSKEEALGLFDKAIALGGPLVSIARLERADHLIRNLSRYDEAAKSLRMWFDSLPAADPLRVPTGLMLGNALYAMGNTRPNSFEEALEIYDHLLPLAEKHPALIYRLQCMRGMVLEQLPDPKDPSKKRESEAFIAYYSVFETDTPPVEWEYFELCGIKARTLLEKAERWPAAIAAAKKLASFKGPHAEEAANRASQLQLKYMIFED